MILFVVVPWGLFYIFLGYCHVDAMRELGFLRRSPRCGGGLVMVMLWPIGVMILAERIRIEKR